MGCQHYISNHDFIDVKNSVYQAFKKHAVLRDVRKHKRIVQRIQKHALRLSGRLLKLKSTTTCLHQPIREPEICKKIHNGNTAIKEIRHV